MGQLVSGSVMFSDVGDSYCIYQACELFWSWSSSVSLFLTGTLCKVFIVGWFYIIIGLLFHLLIKGGILEVFLGGSAVRPKCIIDTNISFAIQPKNIRNYFPIQQFWDEKVFIKMNVSFVLCGYISFNVLKAEKVTAATWVIICQSSDKPWIFLNSLNFVKMRSKRH